jgi:hypothetical protein
VRCDEAAASFDATDPRHAHIHQDKVRAFDGESSKDFLTAASSSYTLDTRHRAYSTPNRFASQRCVIANKYGGHSEYVLPIRRCAGRSSRI